MDDEDLLDALGAAADAVSAALGRLSDWGPAGTRPGQYRSDLVADEAAVDVLGAAGLGVLSEESGLMDDDRGVLVVLDPLDGSTNAAHGIPWFATSLCAVDEGGPRVALVVDQARGVRFHAIRGGGARRDGGEMRPSRRRELGDAVVALSGWPGRHLGWRQYRVLGAAALDLCAVAGGVVDAYLECDGDSLGPWDYLAGALICREAGAAVADAEGRDLVVLTHEARRTPVAAATPELLRALTRSRWEGHTTAPGSRPEASERKTS